LRFDRFSADCPRLIVAAAWLAGLLATTSLAQQQRDQRQQQLEALAIIEQKVLVPMRDGVGPEEPDDRDPEPEFPRHGNPADGDIERLLATCRRRVFRRLERRGIQLGADGQDQPAEERRPLRMLKSFNTRNSWGRSVSRMLAQRGLAAPGPAAAPGRVASGRQTKRVVPSQ
jgi:hypothetical protein